MVSFKHIIRRNLFKVSFFLGYSLSICVHEKCETCWPHWDSEFSWFSANILVGSPNLLRCSLNTNNGKFCAHHMSFYSYKILCFKLVSYFWIFLVDPKQKKGVSHEYCIITSNDGIFLQSRINVRSVVMLGWINLAQKIFMEIEQTIFILK